jgi:hypothetical protein
MLLKNKEQRNRQKKLHCLLIVSLLIKTSLIENNKTQFPTNNEKTLYILNFDIRNQYQNYSNKFSDLYKNMYQKYY